MTDVNISSWAAKIYVRTKILLWTNSNRYSDVCEEETADGSTASRWASDFLEDRVTINNHLGETQDQQTKRQVAIVQFHIDEYGLLTCGEIVH